MATKTRIIRIGNSQGIRIPKPLLEQSGLEGEVELDAEDGRIVIRAAQPPRADGDAALGAMAAEGDDALLNAPEREGQPDDEALDELLENTRRLADRHRLPPAYRFDRGALYDRGR